MTIKLIVLFSLLSLVFIPFAYALPPGPPTGLTATKQTNALAIDLSWTAPTDTGGFALTGYKIERESPVGGGFSVLVADTASTSTTFTDTGLTANTQYNYRVSAINAEPSTSVPSNEASATTNNVSSSPTSLTATARADELTIDLSWTAPASDGGSAITGYKIERESPVGGGFSVLVANTASTTTSYTDTGLTQGTQYNYRVSAINGIGTSSVSNTASATTSDIPGVPTNLSATAEKGRILLSWTAPASNGGSAITGYKIERKVGDGSFVTLIGTTGSTTTSYIDGDLSLGTTYTYRVSAINSIGTGSVSTTASATTPVSGSSCTDCTKPSFTTNLSDEQYPLTIDGRDIDLSKFANTVDTITVGTKTPIDVKLSLSDDKGPQNIEHVGLFTNLRNADLTISQSDTYIVWQKNNPLLIMDPNGFFSNVEADTAVSGNKFEIDFKITFAKPMEKSHIIMDVWDTQRNSVVSKVLDAWKVSDEQKKRQSEFTTSVSLWHKGEISDSEFILQITQLAEDDVIKLPKIESTLNNVKLPKWLKTTADWWLDKKISDNEFENTIKYLIVRSS